MAIMKISASFPHGMDASDQAKYIIFPNGFRSTACGVTSYNDPSGVISSPNHPGNYSNFLYCDYTIYSSTPSQLTMIFTAFEVQQDFDFVTVSN